MTKKTQPSRLTRVLLETADDMRRADVMDAATHEKITLRHLGDQVIATTEPMTGEDIRALRERAHVSQAVFAGLLNVPKVTAISWERGRRQPTGAALRLLDLVRKQPQILQEA